jgi:hypothetical protein
MDKLISEIVTNVRIHKRTKGQVQIFHQRVHMDLFRPLKTSGSGKMYIADIFSKYVQQVAIPDKTATTVASALFSRWLGRHGLPLEMVSDGGKEFCNAIVNEMLKLMLIKKQLHPPTTP